MKSSNTSKMFKLHGKPHIGLLRFMLVLGLAAFPMLSVHGNFEPTATAAPRKISSVTPQRCLLEDNANSTVASSLQDSEDADSLSINLELNAKGMLLIHGEQVAIASARPYLLYERNELPEGKTAADATVFIYAHPETQSSQVQELIRQCQDAGFEQFALRTLSEES